MYATNSEDHGKVIRFSWIGVVSSHDLHYKLYITIHKRVTHHCDNLTMNWFELVFFYYSAISITWVEHMFF